MVLGMQVDIETLNPILTESANEADVLNGIFSTLIKVNEEMEFEPDLLVQLPEVSEDGLEYRFELRDDVLFHDGEKLTAEDVYFTYQMKIAENNAVPSRMMWDKIKEFTVTDPYSFTITLYEPDVTWLEYWAYADASIVPKHLVEEEFLANGEELSKGGDFSRNPIGSGPYELVEWETSDYILLAAFEDYYRGQPEIGQVVFKIIPDANTLLAQFETGEIDIYDRAQPGQYEALVSLQENGQAIEVYQYPGFVYMHADFNLRLAKFQDKEVRQALNYAFPQEEFIATVLGGVGTPAYSDTPPVSWAYNPDIRQYSYNPDKAEELLEEAGWVRGDDGVREKNGERLAFTITTIAGNPAYASYQEIAKQEWEAIGAEVELESFDGPMFGDALTSMNFDVIVFAWSSGFDPDSTPIWHSTQIPDEYGTGQNYAGYKNDRVDELLEAGLKISDRQERIEIYHEVQEILAEELPSLFVYFMNSVVAVPDNLENFRPNPTQANNTWNMYEWKWN
ncbi:extracellular solute-binding protein family 5 [Dethiobacter alkaliphilus AHT 1]|uniref:Extracellular solute-binding protein family 5 n=2 Tax=Dethiobacter TaxID=427925 RepID=C0GHX5_DETAL|nr:extracellular solute-binding protein family 5 [Dethiobacter alkaliphilus AHT 1]